MFTFMCILGSYFIIVIHKTNCNLISHRRLNVAEYGDLYVKVAVKFMYINLSGMLSPFNSFEFFTLSIFLFSADF